MMTIMGHSNANNSGSFYEGGIGAIPPQDILFFILLNIFIDVITYNLYNIMFKIN